MQNTSKLIQFGCGLTVKTQICRIRVQCLAGLNADNINARSRRRDRTELNWTELTGSSQFSTRSQLIVFSRVTT